MKIWTEYRFEAAHFLPNVAECHPCKRVHGHSYRVRIWIESDPDPVMGWSIDFADVDKIMEPVIATYDHQLINDIFENTTAENLAIRIWNEVEDKLPGEISVEVSETGDTGVVYAGLRGRHEKP